jgi:hypothetical protein
VKKKRELTVEEIAELLRRARERRDRADEEDLEKAASARRKERQGSFTRGLDLGEPRDKQRGR